MKIGKKLHTYFIPNARNKYKPHFFRVEALAATTALILFLFGGATMLDHALIHNSSPQSAAVIAAVLVDLANSDRQANGLSGLKVSETLTEAAQLKANDMAAKSYFAHTSPQGIDPWHWFQAVNYKFLFAGENLAVYFNDSSEVESAWMNSPDHRANILNSHFSEVGIAIAEGSYQGRTTTFVVQEFGTPSAQTADIAEATPATPVVAVASVPELQTEKSNVQVKGAATQTPTQRATKPKVLIESDTFIAVKNESAEAPVYVSPEQKVERQASPLYRFGTSPETLLKTLYMFLGTIIVIALTLMIFLEIRHQHPLNVCYGFALLALMSGLYAWSAFVPGHLMIL